MANSIASEDFNVQGGEHNKIFSPEYNLSLYLFRVACCVKYDRTMDSEAGGQQFLN